MREVGNMYPAELDKLYWMESNGSMVKLMDAPAENIQKWYNHAHTMLNNKNFKRPGRYMILNNIRRTWNSCNAELFMRTLLYEYDTDIKTKRDLLDYINAQRKEFDYDILEESISLIFNGLEGEFTKVTISKLMDACFDKLDVFSKKMIGDEFLLRQGIWLTEDEKIELMEKDAQGNVRKWNDVIKERLCMRNPDKVKIKFVPGGLSFAEFRAMFQLNPFPKVSTLPTSTLQVLRDKILLILETECLQTVTRWETILNNIIKVAEYRKIPLEVEECE